MSAQQYFQLQWHDMLCQLSIQVLNDGVLVLLV